MGLVVGFYAPGTPVPAGSPTPTPLRQETPSTDTSGNFTVGSLTAGTYDVRVTGATTLSVVLTAQALASGSNPLDFGTLPAGDGNGDDWVTWLDASLLRGTLGICVGGGGYVAAADFNGDTCITWLDASLMYPQMGQGGQ